MWSLNAFSVTCGVLNAFFAVFRRAQASPVIEQFLGWQVTVLLLKHQELKARGF